MTIKTNYQNHFGSIPTERPLAEIMDEIYTGSHKDITQDIRNETDRVKQNALKYQLPMFYPAIVENDGDIDPTGLVQFELDVDDNPNVDLEEISNSICNIPETIYCFYSPRKGLKFALRTDFKRNEGESTHSLKKRYRKAYKLCKQYVLEHVSVEFDDCCQNIMQACFVSSDSDVYFDEDCSILYVNNMCEVNEPDYFPTLDRQFSELQIFLIVQNIADDSNVDRGNSENSLGGILTKI